MSKNSWQRPSTRCFAWFGLWPAYQAWCVRRLGWRAIALELAVVPEIAFGFLRQYWVYRSIVDSYLSPIRSWH